MPEETTSTDGVVAATVEKNYTAVCYSQDHQGDGFRNQIIVVGGRVTERNFCKHCRGYKVKSGPPTVVEFYIGTDTVQW